MAESRFSRGGTGWKLDKGYKKTVGVMEKLIILIVMMVSGVYTNVKIKKKRKMTSKCTHLGSAVALPKRNELCFSPSIDL